MKNEKLSYAVPNEPPPFFPITESATIINTINKMIITTLKIENQVGTFAKNCAVPTVTLFKALLVAFCSAEPTAKPVELARLPETTIRINPITTNNNNPNITAIAGEIGL